MGNFYQIWRGEDDVFGPKWFRLKTVDLVSSILIINWISLPEDFFCSKTRTSKNDQIRYEPFLETSRGTHNCTFNIMLPKAPSKSKIEKTRPKFSAEMAWKIRAYSRFSWDLIGRKRLETWQMYFFSLGTPFTFEHFWRFVSLVEHCGTWISRYNKELVIIVSLMLPES